MKVYSSRWQGVFLVLYSLRELGGTCSKREVLSFIDYRELYELTAHDLPPYDHQNEPRYHTLLAWARKDALIREWLVDAQERDAGLLSRLGREALERRLDYFGSGKLHIHRCYLWTPRFKKQIDATYAPSPRDSRRPSGPWCELIEI